MAIKIGSVSSFSMFNKETGESLMEIKNPSAMSNIVSKPNKDDLIPCKMEFNGCEEIQIYITKETYQTMMDYKNKTKIDEETKVWKQSGYKNNMECN